MNMSQMSAAGLNMDDIQVCSLSQFFSITENLTQKRVRVCPEPQFHRKAARTSFLHPLNKSVNYKVKIVRSGSGFLAS